MKEKIKIMNTTPEVTEEEIRSYMDFDALLAKKKEAVLRRRRQLRRARNASILLAVAISAPAILFFFASPSDTAEKRPVKNIADSAWSQKGPGSGIPARAPAASADSSSSKRFDASAAEKEKSTSRLKKAAGDDHQEKPGREKGEPADAVYVQAEPADGYPALYEYFSAHLVYPPAAVKDSLDGVVDVEFVIDTKGKATNIIVERSPGPDFDKEVVRLLENMPPWKPASYNGMPVRSKMSLPVTFNLQKNVNEK